MAQLEARRIDLSGTWTAVGAGHRVEMPVPGDVHSALLAAGAIADPYWGTNELDLQPLNGADWVLTRDVVVDAAFLEAPGHYLHFDSIDTVAEVRLNDELVGTSDNMFVRQRFDVGRQLRAGTNHLEVRLRSAETVAAERAAELPYEVPTSEYPVQSPHRNLVRKVQCHAGWDWGCCLMVAGLYGRVHLAAAAPGRIEHVTTTQAHGAHGCAVDVCVEVEAAVGGSTELEIRLAEQVLTERVDLATGANRLTRSLRIDEPRLWWPNGLGEQPLYDLTVRVAGDEVCKRLGLRTLELVTDEDERGLGFRFRVNGVDVFAKGANWIPCDALPSRQTRDVLDDLLRSAAQAHMNMIRVWGGGQYESEDFYDLCDEKGLMVWHDFMFSCSTYPASPEFLASVEQEAVYQVKRLRDHACVALWCGNNEDLGALNWYPASRENRDRYLVDYDRLNEGVLGRVADAQDPTRTFWPSSPCGGRGDYSDNWHDDSRGDMHYWQVWHAGKSFDAYYDVTPRFCSEFGYQSFPSMQTIRTYAPDEQMNVTAPVMEHHQRNPGGNTKITEMFTRYFRMPDGFPAFVYLSQVQQGLAIKTAVEHWRHLRPTCMGTLYWQLNDLWPVCSWSSLEYGGKWKLLHYMARRFYAPLLGSCFQTDSPTGDRLQVWVTSDLTRDVETTVRLRVFGFDGVERTRREWQVAAGAGNAVQLDDLVVEDLAPRRSEVFAVLDLEAEGQALRNEHVFGPWKHCDLPTVRIETRVDALSDGRLAVDVTTDVPVFYLSLSVDGWRGEFDDNAILLLPGESRRLTFTAKGQAPTADQLRGALRVEHLRGTYA
jgi:beta-mannosidase